MIKPKAIIESNRRYVLIPGAEDDGLLDSATLNLDFTGGQLDSRIAFQRTTVGTYYRGQFNQNRQTQSENIVNYLSPIAWASNGFGADLLRPSGISPTGTNTASLLREDSSNGRHDMVGYDGGAPFTFGGLKATFSVYVKASGRNWVKLSLGGGGVFVGAFFDLTNVAVGTVDSGFTAQISDAGNGWRRCAITTTAAAGTVYTRIRLASADGTDNYQGNGASGVLLWGAQLTEGSLLTPYIPTTTAAITQGQIASAAIDVPRFENDPVTGEARGLLIEGGATNLCLQSEDLSTTWVNQSSTDSTNVITAPDGTVSADSFTDVAASSVHGLYQTLTGQSTTATYTISCFVKKGSVRYLAIGHWTSPTDFWGVSVDMDNPTSSGLVTAAGGVGYSVAGATITNVGNGWYRVSVTGVTPITVHYPTIAHRTTQYSSSALFESYTGSTANFTYVWGFQYEQQAFASSYIPTVAATVARGADSAVMTGTNFSSWYNQSEGTVFADQVVICAAVTGNQSAAYFNQAANNFIAIGQGTGNSTSALTTGFWVRVSSTNQAFLSQNPAVGAQIGSVIKTAGAFKANNFAAAAGGLFIGSDSLGTLPSPIELVIGTPSYQPSANARLVRRIAYWPTRLPDATLQSLTT